jgi:hypothetical protein
MARRTAWPPRRTGQRRRRADARRGRRDPATGQYLDNIIVYAHLISAQRG